MDKKNEVNTATWVDQRMSELISAADWQPDVAKGLKHFRNRHEMARARNRRIALGMTVAAALGFGAFAFPPTRVFAARYVEVCVAETNSAAQFLWRRLHMKSGNTPGIVAVADRKTAPDFVLLDASNRPVRLSAFRGKVVLLNFWATWCLPCRTEIPWFVEFDQTYRGDNFAVLGVSFDEKGWEPVKRYIADEKVSYPVTIGSSDIVKLYGGIDSLPATFLLDRTGHIGAVHTGIVGKEVYRAEIEVLLAER